MIQQVTQHSDDEDEISEAMPSVARVKDWGPIDELEFPSVPGTLTVFRGSNGAGKSTILAAVQKIVSGKGDSVTSRDGTTGGRFEFGGVTMKVTRTGKNTRAGDLQLELSQSESQFDIAKFCDPGLIDPAAADRARIKEVVKLLGVSPKIEAYYELVGGQPVYDQFVPQDTFNVADPIATADKIKRAFEAAARTATTAAENHHGASVAKRKENAGIDLDAPHSEATLQAELELAITADSTLRQQRRNADEAKERTAEAMRQLQQFRRDATGPTEEDCQASLQAANEAEAVAVRQADLCRQALKIAEDAVRAANDKRKAAELALQNAQTQSRSIAGWEETIRAGQSVIDPAEETIAAAAAAVQAAREALSKGVLVRAALERAKEAEVCDKRAEESRKLAERFRKAAAGVMDVIAEPIKGVSASLAINGDGRLVAKDHPVRGEVFFHEDLSPGQKFRRAIRMYVEVCRQRGGSGIIQIDQKAYEGLDGDGRAELIDAIAETELVVYTAEATRERGATGIKVEVYGRSVPVA